MKKTSFLLLLTGLAVLTGYLLSKATLIGRTGISLFYKQYTFLKTWWQGAGVVLAVWLLLFWLHGLVQARARAATARYIHVSAIIAAAIGLFITYQDFRNTLSYRLMGERFHLGAYLFWIGWMLVSLYYLMTRKPVQRIDSRQQAIDVRR
ncbi:cytochrome d ubiquinol oxidase subunit II [Paracnuella aquatica]|uniref:cytochrome d ubiquinol oxidase subunit II n=1 Tax=Paracnuella aquatica TaxID=2268757 RepID=UPI000DF015FD|nr:cytochrome d ubiquinol oxidase subunit II [Paracnuella aquatica]RPD48149.1 cytochrome d ubiquinol oxidase subunit II [Paracnuella aquatica]